MSTSEFRISKWAWKITPRQKPFYVCPAFTKLGDLLYEGRGRRQPDLKSAAEMYLKAALNKEPQVGVLEIDF